MFSDLDYDVIQRSLPYLGKGMLFSLGLTLLAMLGGIALGTLLALMRLSSFRILRLPASGYVNLLRSTPLILVIFWFYFLVPLALFFLVGNLRMSVRNALILVAVTLIAASTLARYDTYAAGWIQTGKDWDSLIRKELISRLDSLMFGLLGAWVLHYHPRVWKKYKTPLFIVGLVILALEHKTMALSGLGLYLCVFSLSAVSIGVLFLLPFLSDLKGGNGRVYRTITFISAISYSLYLVNYSLFNLIAILLKRGLKLPPTDKSLFLFFAFWIAAFGLASVLHFFYEMPMMRLRERFPLRAKSPPTRPSPPPRTRPHSPTDAPHGPGIP